MKKRPRVLFISLVCVVLLLVGGGLYSVLRPLPSDQVDDIREVLLRRCLGGFKGSNKTVFVGFMDQGDPEESVDPSDEFFQRLRDLNLDLRKGSQSWRLAIQLNGETSEHSAFVGIGIGAVKKSNVWASLLGQIWAEVEVVLVSRMDGECYLYRLRNVRGNWVIEGKDFLWVS
jgi:hypothetical protein